MSEPVLAYLAGLARERRELSVWCEELEFRAVVVAPRLIRRGVSVGWLPLVEGLHERLLALDGDYRLLDVGVERGWLVYEARLVERVAREGAAAIAAAVAEARGVCELCGSVGRLRRELPVPRMLCVRCLEADRRVASRRGEQFAGYRLARLASADPEYPSPEAMLRLFPDPAGGAG